MFGYVTANMKELSKDQQLRYNAVYCGICRQIRSCASQTARLGLSYDMAFLALLLMSLYEPEEMTGDRACMLHPFQKRSWIDNEYIRYAADMNVALAYYNAQDDAEDDGSLLSKGMLSIFGKGLPQIRENTLDSAKPWKIAFAHFIFWKKKTVPILTSPLPASGR